MLDRQLPINRVSFLPLDLRLYTALWIMTDPHSLFSDG